MNAQRLTLERFLRRLHVRLVMVRAAERAGLCAAVAGAMVLTGSIVLMCRGEDALALSAAALLIGAVVGSIWGLCRRPRLLDVAMQADRQLELADLLTTAWSVRESADPWAAAVVALAGQRCARLEPSQVALSRYGGRAWGGIGLSAALVLGVGLSSNVLSKAPALAANADSQPRLTSPINPANTIDQEHRDDSAQSSPATRARRLNDGNVKDEGGESHDSDVAGAASSSDAATDRPGDRRRESASSGESESANGASADRADMPRGDAPGQRGEDASGRAAGGGEAGGSDAGFHRTSAAEIDASAGGMYASSQDRAKSTAGPSLSGPSKTDRAAAMQKVHSGQVPADARDVVEEYFHQ